MIRKILLRIAYLINKRYHTIEIKYNDIIKYQDNYYTIVSTRLSQKVGCIDTLDISLYSTQEYIYKVKNN